MDERTNQSWCTKSGAAGAKPAPACTIVIFGMGGDLSKRLLIPALYNLACWGLLSEQVAIVGIGHAQIDTARLRDDLEESVRTFGGHDGQFNRAVWERLSGCIDYICGEFEDAATYSKLSQRLSALAKSGTGDNVLFYLAVAERFFVPIVRNASAAKLMQGEGEAWRRVIVEKPFGHDVASARALNHELLDILSEQQIYRIDHFLGKETVQNILAVRFANGFFEPIWNRDQIDHVQITVAESLGVGRRGGFYETTGALRDMVPNHLFQLLTLTAMEPPVAFHADAVRTRKEDVLKVIRPLSAADVQHYAVRGQYDAGSIDGQPVKAYREEPRVDPRSQTETYCALRLMIDNWRWAGVPFYLRTGKRLTRRTTEIAIAFKRAPHSLFRETPVDVLASNWLVLQIQPEEGISLQFDAKVPGPTLRLGNVQMDFLYKDYFNVAPSTGYETLIYDCMIGDPMLFQRADTIEAGWEIVQPVLDEWAKAEAGTLARYPAGSRGPALADALLARDGRAWRPLE